MKASKELELCRQMVDAIREILGLKLLYSEESEAPGVKNSVHDLVYQDGNRKTVEYE